MASPALTAHFGLAQHRFQQFFLTAAAAVTQQDLEDPTYWSHVRGGIATHARIVVVAEDSSWTAEVLVTFSDGATIRTKVLWFIPIDPVLANDTGQTRFAVQNRGSLKWCVVDTEDGRNVRQGLHSQSAAQKQLEEHLLAMKR